MSFENLGLRPELLSAVKAQGYTLATPIQQKSIPLILQGLDIMGGAQTGTGKTAAFVLPLLQLLGKTCGHGCSPRALILTPTRELAAQVAESVGAYGAGTGLKSSVIFGGVNINPQYRSLKNGVDILVATPGRLLDHASQKTLDLSKIEIFVLDEADRMLDMGFIHDIKKVIKKLPEKRQNLLFSATFSDEIKELAGRLLNNPSMVIAGTRNTAADGVSQIVYPVAKNRKKQLLSRLIREGKWDRVLVFTRTKHGANKLAKQLMDDGISSSAIHGNKSQTARIQALSGFKKGNVKVLVATDIAARGLDIDSLPHVVNFEIPNVPEDYVHRIGRTGRAGLCGNAVSLVSGDENEHLKNIERLLKRKIDRQEFPGFAQESIEEVKIMETEAKIRREEYIRQRQNSRNKPHRSAESRNIPREARRG